MTSEADHRPDIEPEPLKRAEELMQRVFEKIASEEEGEELLLLWEHFPRTKTLTQESFFVDHLFKYIGDSQTPLSPDRLKELKSFVRVRSGFPAANTVEILVDQSGTGSERTDLGGDIFDRLVQLEKDALALPTAPKPTSRSTSQQESDQRRLRKTRRLPVLRFVFAGLFLLLLIGFGVEYLKMKKGRNTSADVPAIARILETVDVEWDDEKGTFKKGEEFVNPDKLKLKSGWVHLEFSSGARVLVQGPAEFRISDKNKSFCQNGTIHAYVPPAARGFEIATPFSSVVDLGTEFTLQVKQDDVEIDVVTGSVELRRDAAAPLLLMQGRAVELNHKGALSEKESDPQKYVSEKAFSETTLNYYETKLKEQRAAEAALAEEPNFLFSFDRDWRKATVVGCRSTEGHLPGKNAYVYNKTGDRIEISVPGEFESLTLLAMVRIDRVGRYPNTLLLSKDFYTEPGMLLWQIDQSGAPQLHIQGKNELERLVGLPVLTRKDWKTWTLLGLVIDGKQNIVKHYKDGRLVRDLPWTAPRPLKIGGATIGNQMPDPQIKVPRYLNGAVEEIMIFSRPWNDAEMFDYFEKATI